MSAGCIDMDISNLHQLMFFMIIIIFSIFCLVVLRVMEKEYFCSGNLRFFINDKQKIIKNKGSDGFIRF